MESQLAEIETKLATLPEGRLYCARNGEYFKWYVRRAHKREYLPKEQRELAEQLAYRRYLEELRLDVQSELKMMMLQEKVAAKKYRHMKILGKPGFLELLKGQLGLDAQLWAWQEEAYKKSEFKTEELRVKVHENLYVRSKAEAMIAMMLIQYQIPFQYECELQLGSRVVYPDFKIMHPRSRQIKYWEHFGMTDNYKYCRNNYNKLVDYCNEGIYLGENLIITSETKGHPLDYETIEHRIKENFL